MIIRSGALRDCNHLILSEHRAAWFLQLSSVSYYRIHYQEGGKQFKPENHKKTRSLLHHFCSKNKHF